VLSPWAVFLDRDGTINEEVGLIINKTQLKLYPGVAKALLQLKKGGALTILITNQPVIARGLVNEEELEEIHLHLKGLLSQEGAQLDDIFYCPHHPEKHHKESTNPKYRRECQCRKPKPGMILEAAEKWKIQLNQSYMVGDSNRDIAAGHAAGCSTILVKTGFAGKDKVIPNIRADKTVKKLKDAVTWILRNKR